MKITRILLTPILFVSMGVFSQITNSSAVTPIRDSVRVVESRQNGEQREENHEMKLRKRRWFDLMHKAAPDVSWKQIEAENVLAKYQANLAFDRRTTASGIFANGGLCGEWTERGSKNQAGRCIAMDYYPLDNSLIVISNSGSMFNGNPDDGQWNSTNNQLAFNNRLIKQISNPDGGKRIISAVGTTVLYSDDNGAVFNTATGLSFPVEWGGNGIHEIESLTLANNQTVLYLSTRYWNDVSWQTAYRLYRSVDAGQSWQPVFTFPNQGDDNQMHLLKLSGEETYMYAMYSGNTANTTRIYKIDNLGNVTLTNSSAGFPANISFLATANKIGEVVTIYAARQDNNMLYKSVNLGQTWTQSGTLPTSPYILTVSPTDASKLFTGQVNCYRSYNSGTSWTLVNEWYDYYDAPATKLHADIFNIEYFSKPDGTQFMIINTDGGAYRSDNDLLTVTNISLEGMNNSEYYSVVSDNQANVFLGSQDQGLQRAGNTLNDAILSFDQILSGDFGKMQLTRNEQTLWAEYPGGNMYYYYNATGPYTNAWSMSGTTLPTAGWMLATAPVYPENLNQIYLAGGNLNGGAGSYLIKLVGLPTVISATQGSFNFRNANGAGISALGTTPLDPQKIYVAKEDGSFYYSTNAGTSWTQSAGFSAPEPVWLMGNCIYASRLNPNLVLLGGSGYSNPGVYVSTNGGANFTSMSAGLPQTVVYGLAANPAETFYYAATEAGPYVYSVAENSWFPLNGGITPAQAYFAVDYDATNDIVHFASYGRGLWDFNVCEVLNTTDFASLPKFTVYPNPATESVTLLLNQIAGNQTAEIFDTNGKKVKELRVSDRSKIDISSFAQGIYLIRLQQFPGQSQKIIKQ